jgi:hypothetical protein
VFAAAEPDDLDGLRAALPDARYSDWEGVATLVRTAIERPPDEPN